MENNKIEVISSCLVGTAGNEAAPMSRLALTSWDSKILNLYPMLRGLFFPKPEFDQTLLILRLKNSFSRALDFFPPLAGRIGADPAADNSFYYFLDCNNAGAEFIHADASSVSISDILGPKYIPETVSDLFPLGEYRNSDGLTKPLLGAQVTQLADGVFVGCTANHAVVDGYSLWHFINSWSELSSGSATISKPPVSERWFTSSGKRLIPLPPLENFRVPPQPPVLARLFHLSKESLGKLKSKANSEAGTDKISTLQALFAFLWRSTTRCRNSHGADGEVSIILGIGARSRVPLPDGYFGNAFNGSLIAMRASELMERGLGLGHGARKINEHVAAQSGEAIFKMDESWVENPVVHSCRSFPPPETSSVVVIASSNRYNVYGNDFGWGKPIAVVSGTIEQFDGIMRIFPAAADGGIDVEVCLAPETMQAVEDDEEFMAAIELSEN